MFDKFLVFILRLEVGLEMEANIRNSLVAYFLPLKTYFRLEILHSPHISTVEKRVSQRFMIDSQ